MTDPVEAKHWQLRDLVAAAVIILVWGMNFVAMKFTLRYFTPFQLGAARYLFAALPLVFFIRPPKVAARWVVLFGPVPGCRTVRLSVHGNSCWHDRSACLGADADPGVFYRSARVRFFEGAIGDRIASRSRHRCSRDCLLHHELCKRRCLWQPVGIYFESRRGRDVGFIQRHRPARAAADTWLRSSGICSVERFGADRAVWFAVPCCSTRLRSAGNG